MDIRAKFFVSKVEEPEGATAALVELGAVCRGIENAIWAENTPTGNISMRVLNNRAVAQFEKGEEYEVTFRKVQRPKDGDGHEPEPVTNKYGYIVCETCGMGLGGNKGSTDPEALARHTERYAARDE